MYGIKGTAAYACHAMEAGMETEVSLWGGEPQQIATHPLPPILHY